MHKVTKVDINALRLNIIRRLSLIRMEVGYKNWGLALEVLALKPSYSSTHRVTELAVRRVAVKAQ